MTSDRPAAAHHRDDPIEKARRIAGVLFDALDEKYQAAVALAEEGQTDKVSANNTASRFAGQAHALRLRAEKAEREHQAALAVIDATRRLTMSGEAILAVKNALAVYDTIKGTQS